MRIFSVIIHIALVAIVLLLAREATAQRPQFHLRPLNNWINDPNGPFRDPITSTMHIYMQYNPNGPLWGSINWYHFTSTDYVKWHGKGVALVNDKRYDNWGAYSGSITQNPSGTPVLMYTCAADVNIQRQCIALPPSEDIDGANAPRTLNSFVKLNSNPVLDENSVPNLVGLENFRDPTNFWVNPDNASEWLVAFAARMNDPVDGDHGYVVVFSTADPTWQSGFKYSHAIWHETMDSYRMLECPDLVLVGSDHYLKVSTMVIRQDYWVYGTYGGKNSAGQTIYEEDMDRSPTFIDYGRWYASKQNYDPILGRSILWGLLADEITEEQMTVQGWSGIMDMPRDMEYDANAEKMKSFPMPELQQLRKEPLVNAQSFAAMNNFTPITMSAGRQYELVIDLVIPLPDGSGDFPDGSEPMLGVDVLASADHSVYTRIALKAPSTIDANNDQTGSIYGFSGASNVDECSASCEHDRRCVAWTAVDGSSFSCALMSTFGNVVAANSSTTTGRVSDSIIMIDRTHSGTAGAVSTWLGRAHMSSRNVQFRVFVDGTVVQVFKDGGLESVTSRVYNENSGLTGVYVFATNLADPVQATATLYPMDNIYASWPDFENGDSSSSATSHRNGALSPLSRYATVLSLVCVIYSMLLIML